jgi:ribosomal protein L37AE/L43A
MSRCPHCAGEASMWSPLLNRVRPAIPYCEHCGWNVAMTKQRLRSRIRVTAIAMVFGLLLALLAARHAGIVNGVSIGCAFAGLPAAELLMAWHRSKRLAAAPTLFTEGHAAELRMRNLAANTEGAWPEYYRLRLLARLSAVALPLWIYFLARDPKMWVAWLAPNSVVAQLVAFSVLLVTVLALCSIPLIKWSEWGCPRCGHPFARPAFSPSYSLVIAVPWKLVVDSRCPQCGLARGSSGF